MQPDPNMNLSGAVDLSKVKAKGGKLPAGQPEEAVDLSSVAVEERRQKAKLKQARAWIFAMERTFKGIIGKPSRRELVQQALVKFDLDPT